MPKLLAMFDLVSPLSSKRLFIACMKRLFISDLSIILIFQVQKIWILFCCITEILYLCSVLII